ncbi:MULTISPECIES: helicase-related protein [Desulfovibrio]|uniref:Helicase conserved C-terminal domain-containing protein n=1 Tax=Desulfovibrio desulfuricans TaxID=876 RepID=A0AA94HVE0_DESDE|nr:MULTISPECIES: helicase-related protein [Desulfovibrio]SFW74314.1 Helicase conserved C-terminal domain-containing protein [Desulfovibrio desulfuricans]SPD34821.1 Helicase like [Desulfovibrio sp. G11]
MLSSDGTWQVISREETKKRFRERRAEIMLCTDAAAEGLNFQFCWALINYDMPWNPMRVEQRIGRIDRLGQEFENIRIINLHYADTVETDVYCALRERINFFTNFVGKLQPILARLPKTLADVTLIGKEERQREEANLLSHLAQEVQDLEASGFDLDDTTQEELAEPVRPQALYDLGYLRRILCDHTLLPPGLQASPISAKDFSYIAPGMEVPVRVTTDADFYDAHPESVELWSPGSPAFPNVLYGDR